MASRQWGTATRVVCAVAQRCAPLRLYEEIVAEAQARLLLHVAAGKSIKGWVRFPAQVARSVSCRLRRQEWITTDAADEMTAPAPRICFDDLVAGEALPLASVRGATQKRLVAEALNGSSDAEIAAGLGMPEKEVRRQLGRLAAIVQARQKNPSRTSTA